MRLALLAPLIAGLFAMPVNAQIRIVQPAPDCRLSRRMYDNPFSDSRGYWQPRYAWHVERTLTGLVASAVLRRAHVPRPVAVVVPALVVTALHVRGVIRGVYPLNPMDWFADAWMMSAAAMRPGFWLVGYAATGICFASP